MTAGEELAERMTQRSRGSVEPSQMSSIKTFLTQVKAVAYPTPRFARITFEGLDLEGFTSLGPGEFVYVLLPPAGRDELTVDRGFTWERFKSMPDEERPRGAYYTIREHHPQSAELDLDFLLHSEEGGAYGGGPPRSEADLASSVSRWAARAKPGDRAALWGPRITYQPPADTEWRLLVADETGLPAAAAILSSLPEGARTDAVLEVADESEEQRLLSAGDGGITWVHRGDVSSGRSSSMVEAICALEFPERVSRETIYVWGAGEGTEISALRQHLRNERGLDPDAMSLTPYWRLADHRSG